MDRSPRVRLVGIGLDFRAIHEPDVGRLVNGPDRQAVRNAALLVLQRGLDLLRGLAFAALVPRLLGPPDFGRFALVTSLAAWFSLLSGMGSVQMVSRFLPGIEPLGWLLGRIAKEQRMSDCPRSDTSGILRTSSAR